MYSKKKLIKALHNVITLLWFIVLIGVSWSFIDEINAQQFMWNDPNLIYIIVGVLFGVVATTPISYLFYNYFQSMPNIKVSWQKSYLITFLPWLGKYVPGKVVNLLGFVYYAKTIAGIRGVDSGIFQIHTQVTNLVSSVVIASAGLLVFSKNIDDIIFDKIIVSLALMSIFLSVAIIVLSTQCHRVEHNYKAKFILPHSLTLSSVKLLRGFSLVIFLMGVLPVEDFALEIMLAFVVAMQIGSLAFFAPAGLGVTEGVYLILLSGILTPEQALQIAVIARVWQTVTDLLLSMSSYLLKVRLTILEEL